MWFFKTSDYELRKQREELPYLSKIIEERYIATLDELKKKHSDWKKFMEETGLLEQHQ